MKSDDFQLLSGILKERSGLVLTPDKSYLLESRLTPLARKKGLNGLAELVKALRSGREERLLNDVTEAMTTGESHFFRDGAPFETLRKVMLPRLVAARAPVRRIRIWSAACATGQEPYSIGICLKEEDSLLNAWRIDVIGTDLSTEALEKAKVGMYSQFEVQRGLPIQYLVKYFAKINDLWQVHAPLRAMVQFSRHNLLSECAQLGAFDIVFCRNVLVYFDGAVKREVLERISRVLPADGYLVLGNTESPVGITERFQALQGARGIYRLAAQTSH
jgi:chemotaxis protein methyltransferase CheR